METAVSLIIPIYNAAQYLPACLDCVTAQTLFARTQVLLIDDGSTDASPRICDEYAEKHANVEVLHRKNAGVSAARNAGLERASGKYVAFADADDLPQPQMLELLFDAAERTGAQMTFCAFRYGTVDGEEMQTYGFPQNEPFARDALVRYMLSWEEGNAIWNKLFLRAPIEENRIRMTVGRKLGEDREFILHYLAFCDTLCYVPQALYYYRYVESGAVRRPREDYAERLTTQYASDSVQFVQLGMESAAFKRGGAYRFCLRIAATIDLICRTFSGRARVHALRRFYADKALQKILRAVFPDARKPLDTYTRTLLRCMRLRLVCATRLWMRLMELRMKHYEKRHGGDGA